MIRRDLTNFGRSKQTFRRTADKNLSRVKIWQNRLIKQNRDKLVNHLSYKLRQTCNWTEISLRERQKLPLLQNSGIPKMFKQLRINPGNRRWNSLATMPAGPMNCLGADGIWRFEIFNAVATDKTKICHDKVWPMILSAQFKFSLLMRKGPYSNCDNCTPCRFY